MTPEIYFAQIREDSRVERTVCSRLQPRKIICIGSGGCTAFSLLDDHVQQVIAVDYNPAQAALIELKKAGIAQLDRETFLGFIGERACDDRRDIFRSLSAALPAFAQDFWNERQELVDTGINRCGTTERFYAFIAAQLREQVYGEATWRRLFSCETMDEQRRLFSMYFRSPVWTTAVRILLSKTMHLRFFPAFMFAQSEVDDFSSFFLRQFESELRTKPVHDNYFLSQLVLGEYLHNEPGGMPFYLSSFGYDQARRNIAKLSIKAAPLAGTLHEEKETDCFFLSNVFDWATAEQRAAICDGIRAGRSKTAGVLYRNMFASFDFGALLPEAVRDEEFSRSLHRLERSMMYSNISFVML